MFADDLLICGKATTTKAIHMYNILQSFCQLSGQTPNGSKSGIIFSQNVDRNTKDDIRNIFPVIDINENSVYLGHPLILPNKDRSAAYDFVAEKFSNKLTGYKANKLSHAARLTLINSVFASIPVYYMSNILFSRKLIAKLTAIIRKFWWTGIKEEPTTKTLCLRAWKDICIPKCEGGLGIRNIQAMNRGLILSAAWRIADDPESFRSKVLKSKYYPDTSLWRASTKTPKSAFWSSILKLCHILISNSFIQILDGNSSIWSTPWFPLWQSIYDHLIMQPGHFKYPSQVKDLWTPNQKSWNANLIYNLFDQQTADCIMQVPIINQEGSDILCWKLHPTGKCSSKSAYRACLQDMQQ